MPSLPNGGNLADCYSNVLALTELNTLQWRIYESPGVNARALPVHEDLVLDAYSKCVKDGMLATWRRQPAQSTSTHVALRIPSFTNDALKELWIFWYGNEPEKLNEHTSNLVRQKTDDMSGDESAERTGISIEVRHQLFNALKRHFERNFAKSRIFRFGRWFAKPLDRSHPKKHHHSSKHILGWDLQFFIHGGNVVCLQLRAQYQPTIFRLSKVHLECTSRLPVILSPDSLRGYLVPQKDVDHKAQGAMELQWGIWNNFFVLDNEDPEDDAAKKERIPRMVTVEIDNVRFYYPSSLVCITLEDDLAFHRRREGKPMRQKDQTALAMHTTEELIASDGTQRNPLLLDQVSGLQHFQAVVENSLLNNSVFEKRRASGTSTTNDDGFRAPFPVQADDNTKWNFTENENNPDLHQPCTSNHDCKTTPKELLVIKQVGSAYSAVLRDELRRVEDPNDPNTGLELRVFTARNYRRNAAHRRFSTSSMHQRKQLRAKSPISEDESEPSDCDGPSWSRTNCKKIETGISCNDEGMLSLLNKRRNNFSTSSDDDDRVPSPFTPIRVVSPCSSACIAPYGIGYEMLPEETFANIFSPSTSSLPPDASQQQRAEKYTYSYNPFLRHKENFQYQKYHRKRENRERTRPPFPSPIRLAASPEPEQPGSQETIPATTSPPPLNLGFNEDCAMVKGQNELEVIRKDDLRHKTRRKHNKKSSLAKWATVDAFNMDSVLFETEELPKNIITPLCGFYQPKVEDISPIELCSENEEKPSVALLSELVESREPMTEISESCMDVSSPMDNFLSPPASNELPEQYGAHSWPRPNNGNELQDQYANHSWPRINNGPPSVDPGMNQIYPTPPSILVDQQQFSPSGPVMDIRPIQIKEDIPDIPSSPEPDSEKEEILLPSVDRTELVPLYRQYRNKTTKVPGWREGRDGAGRFQDSAKSYSSKQRPKKRLKKLIIPLDYSKVKTFQERNKKPTQPTIDFNYVPQSDKLRVSQGMPPVAVSSGTEYKCSYDNSLAPRETNTMHSQMPNMMPPYGPNNPMGGPGVRMMGGPMMNQPRMGYNPHFPPHMQGANSFQQLNNFVNGPIPSMYGGMPPQGHMGGNMMPMMGGPNYGNPNAGPMMYGGPQGNMMGNMVPPGYGGDPNNMVHGMQQGNYMNQYGGLPNGGMGMRQLPPQNTIMPQPMSMNVVPATPTQTPVTPQKDAGMPEGSGVALALVLQDTILNLHFDTIFDSCPICSCTGSIKDSALGLYITPADVLRDNPDQQRNKIHPWSGFYTSSSSTDSCACGFSSIRHRYLSMQSGLFLEDSREATATLNDISLAPVAALCNEDGSLVNNQIWFDPANSKDIHMVNLIRNLCKRFSVSRVVNQISLFNETMEKAAKGQDIGFSIGSSSEYIISQIDSTELMLLGNSTIDMALVGNRPRSSSQHHDHKFFQYFHPWGLQVANAIREPETDAWRALMGEICPIIESSMKIARGLTTGTVIEGPLTWRSLIGKRGKAVSTQDDDYLPEPIPYVTVGKGTDLDFVSALAVNDWENAGFSPADVPKDVLYLAIVPDDQFVYEKTKIYMEELSEVYESRNLGHHLPLICEAAREGIISVGGNNRFTSAPSAKYNTPSMHYLDIVGKYVENRQIMSRLRLYTQQMEETLGNIFAQKQVFGRENFIQRLNTRSADQCQSLREAEERNYIRDYKDEISKEERIPIDEFEVPPLTEAERTKSFREQFQDTGPTLPHVIVIYVVNPFTYGSDSQTAVNARTSQLAILRAYNEIIEGLPPMYRPQLQVTTIELSQILTLSGYNQDFGAEFASRGNVGVFDTKGFDFDAETMEGEQPEDLLRSLAMSVYSAPRNVTPDCLKSIQARCMTVFGPASTLQGVLSSLEKEQSQIAYTIPSSPYYLTPPTKLAYVPGTAKGKDDSLARYGVFPVEEKVLHIAYCLSGNEFLFAHVTDSLGRLSDNCTINLRTQTRAPFKYRAKTQILDTLTKLWNFIQGVVTSDIRNCRLVINRLGRIGHGEFRAWTHLLSKTSLRRLFPKECGTCTDTKGITNLPVVLSACLISTEPEQYLRIFPQFNNITAPKGKKKDTISSLSTPEDVSCTHIMVVPVPTYIDLSNADQAMPDDNDDADDIFGLGTLEQDEEMSFIGNLDMGDLMDSSDATALPSAAIKGPNQFFPDNAQGEIQNQPLAIGFHISTAPAGDLPDWFWSSCPSAKLRDTVHMKSSLHISLQCSQGDQDQGDEFMTQSKNKQSSADDVEIQHPLDSTRTDEVLKYVLESHNALSWLLIDPCTGDRRSCLPVHMQKLLELYHTTNRLLV